MQNDFDLRNRLTSKRQCIMRSRK